MRRLIVPASLGCVAVAAFLLLTTGEPESGGHDTTTASAAETAAPTPAKVAAPAVPRASAPVPETPALTDQELSVRIAGPEQRPGESDRDYETRMHWRDRFERFATRANLTAEERQRALRVLADTQLQADAYWELLGDALTDARPPSESPDLSDLEASLEETTLNSLRTFLTSKQMIEFRRRATLSGPYLIYGIIDPLDIEPLPTK